MELKVAEDCKASPKRELRSLRARNQKSAVRTNILEAIAGASGGVVSRTTDEDGVVRMKIVMKKHDLKQMLEVMRGGGRKNIARQSSVSPSPSFSLEQRLNLMRRRHLWRASQVKGSCRSSWTPALQSIPEEF